jgi:hypothetical protein
MHLNKNPKLSLFFGTKTFKGNSAPALVRVPSPNNPDLTCDVIAFDFVPQLLRLLQKPQITNSNTLLIDVNDPMQRDDSGGVAGEAISGSVYNEAYDRLITDPAKQLFVPIIQWIDRTSVSGNERFSLKPYITCKRSND